MRKYFTTPCRSLRTMCDFVKKLQILRPVNTDFIDYKISTKKNNDTIDILREYEKINSLLLRIIKN